MTRQTLNSSRSSLLRHWSTSLRFFIPVVGLLALTAWNLTRSEGLSHARQAYARSDLVSCLHHALDHLGRRPWSREASLLAALSLSRLDYADAAEAYYKHAGKLGLNELQTRAYGLIRGNHRQRAIQAYEHILERWPDNVTALRRLAAVQFTENNIPQLERLADRLIASPGGMAIGYTLRGAVAHNEQNREGAVAAFTRVLEVDPDLRLMPLPRQTFWSYFVDDLIKIGHLEDATRYLSKVLTEAPDALLMNTLGRAYLLQGMLDEAERCYRQAIEWEPANYLPHYSLGKVELQRRRPKEALKYLEAALKLAPRQLDVIYNLAGVYRLLGQPADADRINALGKQFRERSKPARNPKDPWPLYAL